jgi:hypothetical protein
LFRTQLADHVDRPAHLRYVLDAVAAFGEVRLEEHAVAVGKPPLEVVRDHRDKLPARDLARVRPQALALQARSNVRAPRPTLQEMAGGEQAAAWRQA